MEGKKYRKIWKMRLFKRLVLFVGIQPKGEWVIGINCATDELVKFGCVLTFLYPATGFWVDRRSPD